MLLSCPTLTRHGKKLAACAAVVSTLFIVAPTPARAATPPQHTQLIDQTTVVPVPSTSSTPLVHVDLLFAPGLSTSSATVQFAVFSSAYASSVLFQQIDAAPIDGAVSTTEQLPIRCAANGSRRASFTVGLVARGGPDPTGQVASGCSSPIPKLQLRCAGTSCTGIYPLVVTVRGADGSVERRFTTFVDATAGHVGNPVRVAFIAPLNPSGPHPVTNASEVLTALARHSAVPVTIALEPSLLDLSARRRGPLAGQVRSSLQQGRALLATTYAPIDPTALFAAGLGAEVARERDVGRTTLAQVGLASTTPLMPSFVGAATLPSAFDLHRMGAEAVIVSGSQLRVDPATTTGWGQPFNVASGVGSIRAVATDDRLTTLLDRATTDPILVANQILAVLAFRYREAPGLTTPRGVVLTPSVGTQVPAALVDALLRGLASAPELRPVTLATFLQTVPAGGNGSASVRFSTALSRPTARVLANNVTTARATWTSFAPFLSAAPRRYAQIDHQILAAQSLALKTATAVARVTSVRAHFEALTRAVRVSTSSFTLTSQQGTVPLTIASTAKAPLVVHVDLASDRVSFPGGEHFNVTITQAATTVRIPVVAATTGVLPMRISVTAPGTNVELAGASITVQVAATSIVGKALTLGAILVLLWWWFTTWRRSRREAADEASLHD